MAIDFIFQSKSSIWISVKEFVFLETVNKNPYFHLKYGFLLKLTQLTQSQLVDPAPQKPHLPQQ